MRKILVGELESKHGVRICDDPNAMIKLWKEAEHIKSILSTNTESVCAGVSYILCRRFSVTDGSATGGKHV